MNLDELVAQPSDRLILKQGFADVWPKIKISGGAPIQATWLDGVYAHPGAPVSVAVLIFGDAPPSYVVIGTYTGTQQREGTVTAVSAPTCTLEAPTGSGNFVTATYLGSAPTVGNVMRLLWQGTDVTALGVVGGTPAPPPPAPPNAPPTPPANTGTLFANATDSATWSNSYGWNSAIYVDGTDLYQGDGTLWGGPSANYGCWFYNGYTKHLAGLVIKRVQFRLPQRNNAGYNGSQVQLNLYIHSNDSRPGGNVTEVLGPYGFTVLPSQGAHWVDLPTAAGDQLKNGGGAVISGGTYAGMWGIARDGASGQFQIDWSTS